MDTKTTLLPIFCRGGACEVEEGGNTGNRKLSSKTETRMETETTATGNSVPSDTEAKAASDANRNNAPAPKEENPALKDEKAYPSNLEGTLSE